MVKSRTATSSSHTIVAVQTQITFQEWLKQLGKESYGYHIDLLDKRNVRNIWSSPQSKHYIKLIYDQYMDEEMLDNLTIDVLKGFCFGDIPKFEYSITANATRQRILAAKITCTLLKMDPDPENEYFDYPWDTKRAKPDALAENLSSELREDYIGRCLLGMHYESGPAAWRRLIPLKLSNLSVQRMKDAGIELIADDTQRWTLRRRSLIIRRFNPNLQRLLKIYMTNKRDLSASILQLLVPYLILIANKKDYQRLCSLKVFDETILTWEDIDRIAIMPMLMDANLLDSLHEISNAIKYHSDHLESNKTLWLYRFTIMVAVLSLLTTTTSFWAAYQTQRQADAAWAAITHT
jgi:hypothetical protein